MIAVGEGIEKEEKLYETKSDGKPAVEVRQERRETEAMEIEERGKIYISYYSKPMTPWSEGAVSACLNVGKEVNAGHSSLGKLPGI